MAAFFIVKMNIQQTFLINSQWVPFVEYQANETLNVSLPEINPRLGKPIF